MLSVGIISKTSAIRILATRDAAIVSAREAEQARQKEQNAQEQREAAMDEAWRIYEAFFDVLQKAILLKDSNDDSAKSAYNPAYMDYEGLYPERLLASISLSAEGKLEFWRRDVAEIWKKLAKSRAEIAFYHWDHIDKNSIAYSWTVYGIARELASCASMVDRIATELTESERADRDTYAEKAVDVLREAIAKDARLAQFVKDDSAFGFLRELESFQKVVSELEAREPEPSL
jgi:hypothetical protein